MNILFEVLKGMFFVSSIVLGLFFTRGEKIIQNQSTYNTISQIMIPGYLIFVGVMIGYIIAMLTCIQKGLTEKDTKQKRKVYTKSFLIGTFIGLGLSLIYIFMTP